VMPAGQYKLKVVARENQSGKLGTFEQPLVLPGEGDSGLALSSVVVSNQLQDETARGGSKGKQGSENPLQLGNRSILPSVTRVFRTNQNLYVYLESYAGKPAGAAGDAKGGKPAASHGSALPPSIALVFFRGGVKISEAGPFPGKLGNSSHSQASYFVQLPLEKFPPGRYWMQVNVLDPSADRVAFARIPLAIMKVPAGASAGAGK